LLVPLVFETNDGKRIQIEAEEGKSVMEVAKWGGIPSIEGTCGGNLEVFPFCWLLDYKG
jgi:ferredoxin